MVAAVSEVLEQSGVRPEARRAGRSGDGGEARCESVGNGAAQQRQADGELQIGIRAKIVGGSGRNQGLVQNRAGVDAFVDEMDRHAGRFGMPRGKRPIAAVDATVKRRDARVNVDERRSRGIERVLRNDPRAVDHDDARRQFAQRSAAVGAVDGGNVAHDGLGNRRRIERKFTVNLAPTWLRRLLQPRQRAEHERQLPHHRRPAEFLRSPFEQPPR